MAERPKLHTSHVSVAENDHTITDFVQGAGCTTSLLPASADRSYPASATTSSSAEKSMSTAWDSNRSDLKGDTLRKRRRDIPLPNSNISHVHAAAQETSTVAVYHAPPVVPSDDASSTRPITSDNLTVRSVSDTLCDGDVGTESVTVEEAPHVVLLNNAFLSPPFACDKVTVGSDLDVVSHGDVGMPAVSLDKVTVGSALDVGDNDIGTTSDDAEDVFKEIGNDMFDSNDIKSKMKRCLSLHDYPDGSVSSTLIYMTYAHHGSNSVSEQDYVRNIMALPFEERESLMKNESERLRTYGSGFWPICIVMPSEELAAAGFYYTGVHDLVQCAFCRGVLRNWERGDSAMNEHRFYFSHCPLVRGLDCGNSPIAPGQLIGENSSSVSSHSGQENRLAVTERPHSGDAYGNGCSAMVRSGEPQSAVSAERDEHLLISTQKPKHPEHAMKARRMRSFSTWPQWALQSAASLAEAGFYYSGFGDNVKCFYCDGELRNWKVMHYPWEEHARYFKECKYLIDVKGQVFVDETQKKYAVGTNAAILTSAAATTRTSRGSSLEHRSVQRVKSLGFSESKIHATLERFFPQHLTGAMPKFAELRDAVLRMEDEASRARPAGSAAGRSLPTSGRVPASREAGVSYGVAASRPPDTSDPSRFTGQWSESGGLRGPNAFARSSRFAPDAKTLLEPTPSERPLASLHDITFTGSLCLSDWEQRFLEENRLRHKHLECKICQQRPAEVVLLPCDHCSSCLECVPLLKNCPVCATVIRGTIRTSLC